MSSASRSIDINAPIEKVFAVITDFANYPAFVPHLQSVQIESQSDNRWVVGFSASLIKSIDYTVELTARPPHHLAWHLVRGAFMARNDGNWQLEALSPTSTRATYTIALQLSALVPQSITTALAGRNLPEMLEAFKARAETT